MCGIVALAGRGTLPDDSDVRRMRDRMSHRGPDAAELWRDPEHRAVLAHRRLSIVDLSTAGTQPMVHAATGVVVTFNGEIYNHQEIRRRLETYGHRFHSHSDTEVLLASYIQWGRACVDHLVGMFGFAIFDPRSNSLFAARDRAGEKPLYWRHSGGVLGIASEMKVLLEQPGCPRRLDADALEQYLAFGYVWGENCLVAGIQKLPPGHALEYDLDADRLRVWKYWDLPSEATAGPADAEELADRVAALLTDSVRGQLQADVPVGILLSGGLDSSLIVAAAANVSPRPVRTFTVTFPGHGQFDESVHARQVADHFGTVHQELEVTPASASLLPELAAQFDEPLADSSLICTFLVCQLIRQHATVALGGDGGDELFGGYRHYNWAFRDQRRRELLPRLLRRGAGAVAARAMPLGMRGRNYLMGLSEELPASLVGYGTLFDRVARQSLHRRSAFSAAARSAPERLRGELGSDRSSLLNQATAIDFRSYLPDDILVKVDRTSMLSSLEVRAPWLDHRLIELAFGGIPDHLRANEQHRKILLKRLAERLLPAGFDHSRKQGFSLPLAAWLRGQWSELVHDVLLSPEQEMFDSGFVRQLLDGQRQGRSNSHRVFALTFFELWRRHHGIEAPASASTMQAA